MVDGVSTYTLFQATLRDVGTTMTRLANTQNQISSGDKSSDFAGIADRSAEFLDIERRLSQANRYITNNTITKTRLETTNVALNQIITSTTELKNLISTRRTGIANIDFAVQLEAQWQKIAASLNTSSSGQYLFSGTATDTKPVDESTYPSLTSDGELDTGYYLGSSQDITTRSEEGVAFTSNLRADDPAFQQIVEGLALARQANTENDQAGLEEAYDLVAQGLQDVITLQATVNNNKVRVEQTNVKLESTKLYWTNLKAEIASTDLLSASTQLAVDQGILQASFQAFARINSLKLSDYLR